MEKLRRSRINPNQIEADVKRIQVKLQKHRIKFLNRRINKEQLLNRGINDLTEHYLRILGEVNKINQKRGIDVTFTKYGQLCVDLENAIQWWRDIVRDLHVR